MGFRKKILTDEEIASREAVKKIQSPVRRVQAIVENFVCEPRVAPDAITIRVFKGAPDNAIVGQRIHARSNGPLLGIGDRRVYRIVARKHAPEKSNRNKMTHRDLVNAAYRWVLKSRGCGVAFREFNSAACNGEYPDVIGFASWGQSVLIECKVSRSDFHADKKKSFRINPSLGMGSRRYYCCPSGVLNVSDMPDGWGLVYVSGKGRATCVHDPFDGVGDKSKQWHEKNMRAEHGLMYSALRRLHLRGRIDEIYEPQFQNTTS